MRNFLLFAVALGSVLAVGPADAKTTKKLVVDLAAAVAGSYSGDIISDSRGSSLSGVTVTVTRVAPNTVSVAASSRLPTFAVKLTRAMSTIQQVSGDNVFLVDTSKSPWSLDVTVDGASWSGTRN
jgi:hypothetical protein